MLLLFDIDGTLIRRAGPHHRQALEDAVFRVAGLRASTEGIPVQGMLDGDILRLMLAAAGAGRQQIKDCLPGIMAKAQALYQRRCPDLRRKVCPGVRGFLRGVRKQGAPAALVTGNLSRIAWRKMENAGLREHFLFGAFADEGRTRAHLAKLAFRRALESGLIERRACVALIGDHPNDIDAAKRNGFLSVAVATGVVPLEELARHGPNILVPDMRSLSLEKIAQTHLARSV